MIERGNASAETELLAPQLSHDVVQIWRLVLEPRWMERTLARAEEVLCPEEVLRAQRMRVASARFEFAAGRGLLRVLLGRALKAEPRDVRLLYGAHGKPRVESTAGITFSLSHSRGVIVLALGLGLCIGVDVEFVDLNFATEDEWMQMARDYFRAAEVQQLSQVPPGPGRALAFYQQWVRKEAFAKAQGTGLASSLIHLRKPADRMDQMGSDPEVGDDPVRMIEVGADHVGAIATVGARPKLEFYDAAPFLACEATT